MPDGGRQKMPGYFTRNGEAARLGGGANQRKGVTTGWQQYILSLDILPFLQRFQSTGVPSEWGLPKGSRRLARRRRRFPINRCPQRVGTLGLGHHTNYDGYVSNQ